MAKKEFNLSVLENVTTFDTPLKECFDYEAILSLIKEEIDIEPTEDELEYQKTEKLCSPLRGAKRKRTYTSEGVFKSPYKKKYCLKLKSPGSLSTPQKEKPFESNYNNVKSNRERTLGTVKPRRSSLANQRRFRTSISHSETSFSDGGDENGAERPNKILKNGYREPIVQQNGIEFKNVLSIAEPTVDSSNADDEISISSKGESTSLATTDPLDVQTANDDSYVESSQSTQTSSELRQRLNRRRSTIDIKTPLSDVISEDLSNVLVKSEDENEHFTLTLSPSSKSSASSIKKEPITSRLQAKNRKSICRVSPLKNVSHEHENSHAKRALSATPLRQGRRKISVGSPLRGLTQELENCIRNGDYVEMCDSETESMSFTFETIQLLNDYEDCNQQANNKIFDKILSSPSGSPAENRADIADNLITPKKEQFIEDPLHVDYTNEDPPPSTSKNREIAEKNLTRIQTIQDQINADPLDINENAIEDVPSTSKAKKLQKGEEKGSSESKLDEGPQHMDDSNTEADFSSKSTAKKRRKGNRKGSSESELDEEPQHTDDSNTEEDCSSKSKSTAKKRRKGNRKGSSESELDEEPQHMDDSNTEDCSSKSKSTAKKRRKGNRKVSSESELDEEPQHMNDSNAEEDCSSKSKSTAEKRRKGNRKGSSESELDEESPHTDEEDDSSRSTEKKRPLPKKKLRVRRCREISDEFTETFQYSDDSDATGDASSTSNREKKKERAKKKTKTAKKKSYVEKTRKKEKRKSRKLVTSEDSMSDDSDTTENGSCKSTEQKSKVSKKNLTARKCREGDETDETSRCPGDSDTTRDDSSTSGTEEKEKSARKKTKLAKRKSSVSKTRKKEKKKSRKDEISDASMSKDESDSEATDISDWSPETSATEMESKSDEESARAAKSIRDRRRSSSKNKKSVNMNLSDSEVEERLALKAAKLAEKIAAAKKKNALPDEVYERLFDLTIKLRHVPPPQHDVKDGVAATMTAREEKRFLKYASLNKGKYSTAEDEIIKKNWNDFCEDHDWDPDNSKPFLSLKHGDKFILSCSTERKKFAQFLANGLPNRPLFSVYRRFRLLFNKRYNLYKRYKAREDEKILAYTTCHSPERRDGPFAELAQIMKRSSASIWNRNKTLKEMRDQASSKVEWNLPLVGKFIKTLLDITISDELIDLKDALLPRVVWRQMEKKMEIKWNILRKFWEERLHVQLFAPGPILMNELKIKLIEYMRMENVRHNRDVRWDDLAKYFDGYTIPFLRYVFNMLTTKVSKELKARGFVAMVKFLHSKKIKYLTRKPKDRCLPRIFYKDAKAQLVAEDMEY